MDKEYLETYENYIKFIKRDHPEIEDYVVLFSQKGLSHVTIDKFLQNMYTDTSEHIDPIELLEKKVADYFFSSDENGRLFYNKGELTERSKVGFKDFLVDFGFTEKNAEAINNANKPVKPGEFIIVILSTLLNKNIPKDTNLIRWGRCEFKQLEDYLLNISRLKAFVVVNDNLDYIKSVLDVVEMEFMHSNIVKNVVRLLNYGTCDKKMYSELPLDNLNKCRKYLIDLSTLEQAS